MLKNKAFIEAIIDRMKFVLDVTKDSELAEAVGATRTAPAVWKSRPTLPINELVNLAFDKKVNFDWLMFGRGAPDIGEAGTMEFKEISSDEGTAQIPVFDLGETVDFENPPVFWRVSLGWLNFVSMTAEETIFVREVCDNMEPTLERDRLVIVDRRPMNMDGVFLVRFGDVVAFKRIQRLIDGSLRIINDNKKYADETIKDLSAIEILGQAIISSSRVV